MGQFKPGLTPDGKLQAATFDERLIAFGPELASFLKIVWPKRTTFNYSSRNGFWDIYDLYVGSDPQIRKCGFDEVNAFLNELTALASPATIDVQDYPKSGEFTSLSEINNFHVMVYYSFLGATFYHFMFEKAGPLSRIYINAATNSTGLDIMKEIIKISGQVKGISEAKIAGPGMENRNDTIVMYMNTAAAQKTMQEKMTELQKKQPSLFKGGVPALVKEIAPGIGISEEPPHFEIVPKGGARHSFGSFFSMLIWMALKNTPNVMDPKADGRHMLDNLKFSFSMLGIDPADPVRFPDKAKLEMLQAQLDAKKLQG